MSIKMRESRSSSRENKSFSASRALSAVPLAESRTGSMGLRLAASKPDTVPEGLAGGDEWCLPNVEVLFNV